MAIARLVMQQWKEEFKEISENSNIKEILSALYVDDGRSLQRKLFLGERYVTEEKRIRYRETWELEDRENEVTHEEITRREMFKAMNSVNPDLSFTMELVTDFEEKRLPTLSFSIWSTEERYINRFAIFCARHKEKSLR